jgi:hypothetical protein
VCKIHAATGAADRASLGCRGIVGLGISVAKPYPGKCARELISFSRQTPELSGPVVKCAFNRTKLEGNVKRAYVANNEWATVVIDPGFVV